MADLRRVPLCATFRRPIAHRGLHRREPPVIAENTAAAFEAAIACGFGIECDVRAARDGLPVIHHDPVLAPVLAPVLPPARTLVGGEDHTTSAPALSVADLDEAAIATCRDEHGNPLLTLAGGLQRIAGRTPILVELKFDQRPPVTGFLPAVAAAIAAYHGPVAVMSFEAAPLASLAEMLPDVPRGIVAEEAYSQLHDVDRVGASFIAYRVEDLPNREVAKTRSLGATIFAWTVRSPAQWQDARRHCDAPICEGAAADLIAKDATGPASPPGTHPQ